jgi:hypothetical protein
MKYTINKPVKIDIKYLKIEVPVRYEDEDIPYDAPMRQGDEWNAIIDIDRGTILDWPVGRSLDMYMKVCDSGCYHLLDGEMTAVASLINEYVPHGVVPGEYGDYIHLNIDKDGKILNWGKNIDLDEFFQ